MIGATLKRLLDEREMNAGDLARLTGINSNTLYSVIRRDSMRVDFDTLLKICAALEVPLDVFYRDRFPNVVTMEPAVPGELELIAGYRRLDESGRELIELVLKHELGRHSEITRAEEDKPAPIKMRTIPLYLTPAAAGYASPAFGDDYIDHEVPEDSEADFAARISGDSMEPYIADGSIVLVSRKPELYDGDVGLFYVDGDMKCKQFCEDSFGNTYLLSLNRERSDSDQIIRANSDITLFCFGKVLLSRRPPLP